MDNIMLWDNTKIPPLYTNGLIIKSTLIPTKYYFEATPNKWKNSLLSFSGSSINNKDISKYKELLLLVKTNNNFNISFNTYGVGDSNAVPISKYVDINTIKDKWAFIRIPLSDMINSKFNFTKIQNIVFSKDITIAEDYNFYIHELFILDSLHKPVSLLTIDCVCPRETPINTSINPELIITNYGPSDITLYNIKIFNGIHENYSEEINNILHPGGTFKASFQNLLIDKLDNLLDFTIKHSVDLYDKTTTTRNIYIKGVTPDLVIEGIPDNLDIGSIPENSSLKFNFKIRNDGNDNLFINNILSENYDFYIEVVDTDTSGNQVISPIESNLSEYPINIEPLSSKEFNLIYSPKSIPQDEMVSKEEYDKVVNELNKYKKTIENIESLIVNINHIETS